MRKCIHYENKEGRDKGPFFNIPKDERRVRIWSNICSMEFSSKDCICEKHFFASDMRKVGKKYMLMSNAMPYVELELCEMSIRMDLETDENRE